MLYKIQTHIRLLKLLGSFTIILYIFPNSICGQEKYILGEEKKLQIIVYVMGEVKRPGEYQVLDNTNVLELIAKAGGPTEFSNLKSVIVTRTNRIPGTNSGNVSNRSNVMKKIIKVDVHEYMNEQNSAPIIMLQPGDIVTIPGNTWRKWDFAVTVIRDIAVIATTYFLYLRATK